MDQKVQRGIELLNVKGPRDWFNRIDLARLNMQHGCDCILGQLYRANPNDSSGYVMGLAALGLEPGTDSTKHGFDYHAPEQDWVEAITALREGSIKSLNIKTLREIAEGGDIGALAAYLDKVDPQPVTVQITFPSKEAFERAKRETPSSNFYGAVTV